MDIWLISSFSIGEDTRSRINEVNSFLNNGREFKITSIDFEEGTNWLGKANTNRWYGGSKMMETSLFMGAFNPLDLDGHVEHIKTINGEELENVQVIVKEQEADKFKILVILLNHSILITQCKWKF